MAFGRAGSSFVAVVAGSALELRGDDELIQRGLKQFWVIEASSSDIENFEDFQQRIRAIAVGFDGDSLSYGDLSLKYGGDFTVDGVVVDAQHKRFDSKYCVGEREAESYRIAFAGETLEVLSPIQ
jgi:hypothetical protein